MFSSQLEYVEDTLYIYLNGIMKRKEINAIKKKIYYIVDEYMIDKVVINIKNIKMMDRDRFYDFLDEYNIRYDRNLTIVNL